MHDLIIIGAGPTGIFAATEAGKNGLKFIILDSFPGPGGSLYHLLPHNLIFDSSLENPVSNRVYINSLLGALESEQEWFHSCLVTAVQRKNKRLEVKAGQDIFFSRNVLICAGNLVSGDLSPLKRRPDDLNSLAGKDVLVYGGKQEATGMVTEVGTVANSVEAFTPADLTERHLYQPEPALSMTAVSWPWELIEVNRTENKALVRLVNCISKEEVERQVDSVVEARQKLFSSYPFSISGVEMERNRIKVNSSWETSIPGISACGPCSSRSNTDPGLAEIMLAAQEAVKHLTR